MRVLCLGASGQIGRHALPRLRAAGHAVLAASRTPPGGVAIGTAGDPAAARWQRLDLAAAPPPQALDGVEAVLSAGPLDLAVRWLAQAAAPPQRVVAFSSTSADSKQAASDPVERALAARLQAAEDALLLWAADRGVAVTLLRPTLVYGAGLDRNLSRIAALARRLGWVALPTGARGRRQPVHADDLAAAAVAALALPRTPRARYDLPGGETLAYRAMVERVLACLHPRPRLVELPLPALRAALALAHACGRLGDARASVLQRMREDLVYDPTPAVADLGYAPRRFALDASMLALPA